MPTSRPGASPDPVIFAHRGLPGRFQNSLAGVTAALEAGYPGVEVDVVVTADGRAVLSHDPWLLAAHVRRADGGLLGDQRPLIRQLTLGKLGRTYRFACPLDPDRPLDDRCEGPTTLDDVLAVLADFPGVALYVDLKVERPRQRLTAGIRRSARGVLTAWRRAGLGNPLWVEAGSAANVAELRSQAGDLPLTTVLSVPRFDAGTDDRLEAALAGLGDLLGVQRPERKAEKAGADHFATPRQIFNRAGADAAAFKGRPAVLFGIDQVDQLEALGGWPLAGLIVDDCAAIREHLGLSAEHKLPD